MSDDTRGRIIAAAEVLFARKGYDATTVRQITEEAGANVAAVHYHFGSKERLLAEVLDRIVGPLNEERLALLDEADPEVRAVLRAFLLPDVRLLSTLRHRDPELPRFVARMYVGAAKEVDQLVSRQFGETQRRFFAAFQRALPGLSDEEIGWRLQCVVGIVVYLFAGVDAPGQRPMMGADIEADIERLLTVTVPLMSAKEAPLDTR